MKSLPILALFATLACAQYAGPKTVYILPMAAGLDQYLAQWLTKDHFMQVVADPKAAEVVMTDRLGEAFEQKMKQIHPDSEKKEKSDKDGKDKSDTDKSDKDKVVKKTEETAPHTFRSTKPLGTIFLVDAKSRQVIWSDYHKPPRTNSDSDLNRAAEQIAKQLAGPSSK
jgi:hypothetical protein